MGVSGTDAPLRNYRLRLKLGMSRAATSLIIDFQRWLGVCLCVSGAAATTALGRNCECWSRLYNGNRGYRG